jgi:hypothetical protein
MSFDDSTSDNIVTRRHFGFVPGRDEEFIPRFNSRLKLAAAKLRRCPNPGRKLAATYFSRKEIVRLYRRSRLIFTAACLSHGLFSLV